MPTTRSNVSAASDSGPAARPPSPAMVRLARRCEALVWLACVVALLGPLVVWTGSSWLPRVVIGFYGLGGVAVPEGVATQLIGAAIGLVPALLLTWGLLGMVPLFRSFARGALFAPVVAGAVGRLGRALVAMAFVDPLARLAARLLASGGIVPAFAGVSLGIGTRALVFIVIGATLLALAAVLREAARVAAENDSFV